MPLASRSKEPSAVVAKSTSQIERQRQMDWSRAHGPE